MKNLKIKILFNIIVFSSLPVFSQTNFMPTELIAELGNKNLTIFWNKCFVESFNIFVFWNKRKRITSGRFTTNATSNLKSKDGEYTSLLEDPQLVILMLKFLISDPRLWHTLR